MRLYIQGERLLDENAASAGLAKMHESHKLAWELDNPDWPEWGETLYNQLTNGSIPLFWPPVLATADTSSAQPELAVFVEKAEGWWEGDSALVATAKALHARNHVVIDNFLGRASHAGALRDTLETAWSDGLLQPHGALGSDHTCWVDVAADPVRWAALAELVGKSDHLVHELRRVAPELAGAGGAVFSPKCPLVCRYGAGAALSRHSDNPHRNNSRWLSVIYYTNQCWCEADGGCLRFYKPEAVSSSITAPPSCSPDESSSYLVAEALLDESMVDVAPLDDRLVLFFSDLRAPHEVLQVHANSRFATTLWYTESAITEGSSPGSERLDNRLGV
jgi:hypoxia-inducible factor (prolyl hydroxylase)